VVGSDGNFAATISNRVYAYDRSHESWTETGQLTSIGAVEASSFPLCSPGGCGDGNACTDDICNPDLGCQNPGNSDACDDGDLCSDGDVCSASVCAPGPLLDCTPAEPCQIGYCDALLGCVSEPDPGCEVPVPALSSLGRAALCASIALVGLGFGAARPRRSLRA